MWTLSENKEWNHLEQKFDWIKRMSDVPQDQIYHAEGNVAVHTQMVIEALQQDEVYLELNVQEQEILWAAALLHDVEKFSTTVLETDGRITSHGHARKGALKARQILYRDEPTPFELREQIVGLVLHHGLPLWVFEKPDPVKALVTASLEVNTKLLALLARADAIGRICTDQQELLYKIDCFEALCQEYDCWGKPRTFLSDEAKFYYFQHEDTYLDYVPFEQETFQVVLMSGLPGAGKDTYVKKHYADVPVVSPDAIREERGIKPTDKTGNGQVIQQAKEMARGYLRKGQPFVWNATNITRQMRQQLIDLFSTYKASVKIVYLEVPFKQLHTQNKAREAQVPSAVIDKMIDKLEVPALHEACIVEYEGGNT